MSVHSEALPCISDTPAQLSPPPLVRSFCGTQPGQSISHSIPLHIATLPLQIFTYAISPYDDWHRQAWAGALVLILMVLTINIGVRVLTRYRIVWE